MIAIRNLRNSRPTEEWQVRVDRSSPLGNPHYMKDESERDAVCIAYENYFKVNVIHSQSFKVEVQRLKELYKKHGKLELYCWCYPKRCHAETIKKYLESRI